MSESIFTKHKEKSLKRYKFGGVAQLGEHLPCTQGIRSSILLISTKGRDKERAQDVKEFLTAEQGRIAQVVRAHAW